MAESEREEEETDLVKMLYVTSLLLLDSSYIRFLQTLVTDRISAGDMSYYRELVPIEEGDNFKLLDNGRIDRSYYEARKARLPQELIVRSEEIAAILEYEAQEGSIKVDYLWQQCNFKTLQIKANNIKDQIIDRSVTENKGGRTEYATFLFLLETAKRAFSQDKSIPESFQIINAYLVETLYLLSIIGMYDLYNMGCCVDKLKWEPVGETVENINDPTFLDVMLNPSVKNMINYLSSSDLSKESRRTPENINSHKDLNVYLNDVYYPFGLLFAGYDKYIIMISGVTGWNMLKPFRFPEKPEIPKHLHAVHANLKDSSEDLIEYIHRTQEVEQGVRAIIGDDLESNSSAGGHIEYGKKQRDEDSYINYYYKGTDEERGDIIQETIKMSIEGEAGFRAFATLDGLMSYELKGSPYNLIAYIRRCAESKFIKTAEKSEGLYSGRRKKFPVSDRTLERYKEEIRDGREIDYSEKIRELTAEEVEVMSWEKESKQEHQLEGHINQETFVNTIVCYLKRQGIDRKATTIRTIIVALRKSGQIPMIQKGRFSYFKNDNEELLEILNTVAKIVTEKIISKKGKAKRKSPPQK